MKKVSEKEKQQKPSFVDSGTRTNGRPHYPPQALATTHLSHHDIQGTFEFEP